MRRYPIAADRMFSQPGIKRYALEKEIGHDVWAFNYKSDLLVAIQQNTVSVVAEKAAKLYRKGTDLYDLRVRFLELLLHGDHLVIDDVLGTYNTILYQKLVTAVSSEAKDAKERNAALTDAALKAAPYQTDARLDIYQRYSEDTSHRTFEQRQNLELQGSVKRYGFVCQYVKKIILTPGYRKLTESIRRRPELPPQPQIFDNQPNQSALRKYNVFKKFFSYILKREGDSIPVTCPEGPQFGLPDGFEYEPDLSILRIRVSKFTTLEPHITNLAHPKEPVNGRLCIPFCNLLHLGRRVPGLTEPEMTYGHDLLVAARKEHQCIPDFLWAMVGGNHELARVHLSNYISTNFRGIHTKMALAAFCVCMQLIRDNPVYMPWSNSINYSEMVFGVLVEHPVLVTQNFTLGLTQIELKQGGVRTGLILGVCCKNAHHETVSNVEYRLKNRPHPCGCTGGSLWVMARKQEPATDNDLRFGRLWGQLLYAGEAFPCKDYLHPSCPRRMCGMLLRNDRFGTMTLEVVNRRRDPNVYFQYHLQPASTRFLTVQKPRRKPVFNFEIGGDAAAQHSSPSAPVAQVSVSRDQSAAAAAASTDVADESTRNEPSSTVGETEVANAAADDDDEEEESVSDENSASGIFEQLHAGITQHYGDLSLHFTNPPNLSDSDSEDITPLMEQAGACFEIDAELDERLYDERYLPSRFSSGVEVTILMHDLRSQLKAFIAPYRFLPEVWRHSSRDALLQRLKALRKATIENLVGLGDDMALEYARKLENEARSGIISNPRHAPPPGFPQSSTPEESSAGGCTGGLFQGEILIESSGSADNEEPEGGPVFDRQELTPEDLEEYERRIISDGIDVVAAEALGHDLSKGKLTTAQMKQFVQKLQSRTVKTEGKRPKHQGLRFIAGTAGTSGTGTIIDFSKLSLEGHKGFEGVNSWNPLIEFNEALSRAAAHPVGSSHWKPHRFGRIPEDGPLPSRRR